MTNKNFQHSTDDLCELLQYDSILSPAESRNLNSECLVPYLSYDNHDIWHVLGAVSIFFTFVMIMTLDDGLFKVPRSQIAIFWCSVCPVPRGWKGTETEVLRRAFSVLFRKKYALQSMNKWKLKLTISQIDQPYIETNIQDTWLWSKKCPFW